MLGSMYSYKKLIDSRVETGEMHYDDPLDKIDDPYDLYDDNETISEKAEVNSEEVDLVQYIKDEKKRHKTNSVKNTSKAAPALVSLYRVVPYIILILGFIGLNNNKILILMPYLMGLGIGVIVGLKVGQDLFVSKEE
jgi:hypothetical protein